MPSTINGIGTHYYGKKNHTARIAACKSCQRMGNLESYDTRLWFVAVFIPFIPLGRKRIIDKCPSCTRHYVVTADVYEQSKQLQTSASLERFRREPSADSAIAAHGQLLAFHELEQAADFRQTALERFPDHAGLRAGMAAQLREMSSFDKSARLFQQALELDPDLPEARAGVAQRKMAEGNLDEALVLLDFLMEPGAAQQYSLGPINTLAGSLQHAGRHQHAIQLAKVLLREHPKLGDDHSFRSFVKRSEKALGRPDSILPERRFSLSGLFRSEGTPYAPWQRKLAIGSIAAALLLGGLAINNEYIRRHRTLHVLNATGQAAQVQVDDQAAATVNGLGRLTVSEGPHIIKVSGPTNETHNIALDSGYFDRWFSKPVWILNVGGEAVLEDITHIYSSSGTPGQRRLVVGETFYRRPHIDYIFTAAPNQLEVKNKNQDVIKTEVGWAQSEDLNAFMETIETNHDAAMDFAEKRLRRNPEQADLLRSYVGGSTDNDHGRIEVFLRSELDRRPVDVPWHREYQNVAELNKHDTELIALYDKYLAADPSNASLLYLRGRADTDWEKQESFDRRAIEANAKNGWPWYAIAARASSQGRWDDCQAAALKARELKVNEPAQIAEFLHDAGMAKGDASAMVVEYRAGTNTNSHDISGFLFLIDALAASGKESEIEPEVSAWTARLPDAVEGQIATHLRAMGLYYAGKLEECMEFCNSRPILQSVPSRLHALITLGHMKEATNEAVFGTLWGDPWNLLAVSVGFRLDGMPEDSARWRENALGLAAKVGGATDGAKALQLLGGSQPPSIKELYQLYLPPANRAIIMAALADRFPAERELYLAEASRFNISRKPSYQLIKRAIEQKTPERP